MSSTLPAPLFKKGDRVTFCVHKRLAEHMKRIKSGTVVGIKDDEWERKYAVDHHYHVEYDDGTFETYEAEYSLVAENTDKKEAFTRVGPVRAVSTNEKGFARVGAVRTAH